MGSTSFLGGFFSKRRIIAIVIGVFAGLTFYLLAFFEQAGVGQDLAINLAATAFAIPFVTSIIEYEIERSEAKRAEKVVDLMKATVKNMVDVSFLSLALIFNYQPPQRKDFTEGENWLERVDEDARVFLNKLDFQTAEIVRSQLPKYTEILNKRIHELDEALSLFGFAMTVELKGAVLDLRSNFVLINTLLSGDFPYDSDLVEISLRTRGPGIYQALKDLDQLFMKR